MLCRPRPLAALQHTSAHLHVYAFHGGRHSTSHWSTSVSSPLRRHVSITTLLALMRVVARQTSRDMNRTGVPPEGGNIVRQLNGWLKGSATVLLAALVVVTFSTILTDVGSAAGSRWVSTWAQSRTCAGSHGITRFNGNQHALRHLGVQSYREIGDTTCVDIVALGTP